MIKGRSRAAAVAGLTVEAHRNEEGPRPFHGMYQAEEHADPMTMTASPVFETDGAKTYIRFAAFVLATLPLIAFVVLTAKAIF
jgi:hypothetical protein